jgi:Pyruvate/2-oxoglutarate dehydrogenase complex, dehydrogenase (E1) component, eukaryotic type, beta subunit
MSNGQITLPLVIRTLNGAGARFGSQHSQSLENWAMAVPGIKVVAPSNAADAKGLLLAAIRDPDPVIFFEHKYLLSSKCEVPEGEHLVPLGKAAVVREGSDITIIALAAMVPKALKAADTLAAEHGISATVIDLRTLVPLDTQTLLRESARTGRIFTVEENPRLCGWGAEIVSIIQEKAFSALKQPIVRITTPHVPIPASDQLEDAVLPSVARIVSEIRQAMPARRAG